MLKSCQKFDWLHSWGPNASFDTHIDICMHVKCQMSCMSYIVLLNRRIKDQLYRIAFIGYSIWWFTIYNSGCAICTLCRTVRTGKRLRQKRKKGKKERKRRLEIKEAKENPWKWKKKKKTDHIEGFDARSMEERKKMEGDLEENIEKIDNMHACMLTYP